MSASQGQIDSGSCQSPSYSRHKLSGAYRALLDMLKVLRRLICFCTFQKNLERPRSMKGLDLMT